MKRLIRGLAESCARAWVVRKFILAIILVSESFGRLWSFLRVRAILSVPSGSSCHWSVQYKFPENIVINGPVMISPGCVFGAKAGITLGGYVRISQGVHIETASLDINGALPYRHIARPISIEDGVWLGAHVIVLGGVTIGANAVIGAGVVVSKDVAPGAIMVGSANRAINKKAVYS